MMTKKWFQIWLQLSFLCWLFKSGLEFYYSINEYAHRKPGCIIMFRWDGISLFIFICSSQNWVKSFNQMHLRLIQKESNLVIVKPWVQCKVQTWISCLPIKIFLSGMLIYIHIQISTCKFVLNFHFELLFRIQISSFIKFNW